MGSSSSSCYTLVFASTLFLSMVILNAQLPLRTYIVHLHPKPASSFPSKLQWHLSFLHKTLLISTSSQEDHAPVSASARLLYSYRSSVEGFAALLSDYEAEFLRKSPDVIAVNLDRNLKLHTTYSYKFLGLDDPQTGAWFRTGFGKGTVIGVLDTGVWPKSPSFDDQGMPLPPKKWRGVCQEGQNFNSSSCNNKLVGARFFIKGHRVAAANSAEGTTEYLSPRDSSGHGTHTASTAAGSTVQGASVLGNGAGVAHGMAPGAHIAVYKVCWFKGCYSSDILAAMDVAIRDGVDVLSLSLGGLPVPFYDDDVAIGSFQAVERGISVICAAGNNGPGWNSVANEAPWVTTVGASTLDRKFPAFVRIGSSFRNKNNYLYGESVFPGNNNHNPEKELELVYVTGGANNGSEFCLKGSLSAAQVAGKMVVCDRGINGRAEKGEVVKKAGGAAMILANTETNLEEDSVDAHVLPALLIGYSESLRLKTYINSTKRPTAKIHFLGTVTAGSAPGVARFSSRGPSLTDPEILKPDVIAPGVNIIAAWPQNVGPSGLPEDSRRVNFTVMSGTSMACPHVSGIAALVRSAHPNWSPAAVKSGIMTTADVADQYGRPIMDGDGPAGPFAMGSGHISPDRAIDPGLVYDIRPEEYILHLCSIGYRKPEILIVTRRNVSCDEMLPKNRGFSLNYPAISAVFRGRERVRMIQRRVTNVSRPRSVYTVQVKAPKGVKIIVKPKRLVFERINQTLGYKVYVIVRKRRRMEDSMSLAQGELVWVHSRSLYRVRSPITVSWVNKR